MQYQTKDPLINQQLDEYRLEALLGQGGMARVYRGLDVYLRRYVAVKVIDAPFRAESEYTARFQREARAIAQLEHPHIVRLYRYGEVDNMLYMAMQYIEGVDLQTMLASYEEKGELMAPEDVRQIIGEICLGLDYAHNKGVIHRDMKPANVIIDTSGQAFIADFGLALMTELGTQGEIFGTPQYISPEQAISSAGAVPQSDLYAVGIMLYRMFTGVLPFTATEPLEVAMWHITESPPPPREQRPSLTPEIDAFILKTLAKEPKERYPTGAALVDALDTALTLSRSTLATTAASGLSIVERVSLNQSLLPPLPAGITPVQTPPPPTTPQATVEESTVTPPAVPRNWLIAGGVALLVLLALWLGFTGFGGSGEVEPTTVIAGGAVALTESAANGGNSSDSALPEEGTQEAAPTLISTSSEAVTPLAALPVSDEGTTAAATETGAPSAATTATSIPELLPPSPGQVYLPHVARQDQPPTPLVPLPTPTSLPPATATPPPTETTVPPNTPAPTTYQLLIVANKEDSLFIMNQSAGAFPLASLHLGRGEAAIQGSAWGLDQLEPGSCVTVWKDTGNPKPPDIDCTQVGPRLTREGSERFWKNRFDIIYNGTQIAVCNPQRQCLLEITE